MSRKIEEYLRREKWSKARKEIIRSLKREPENHWLLTRLSTTYYEERNYKKSLKISKKALSLSPGCPLGLWDYACSLDMLGRSKEALQIYLRLIKRGAKSIAYGECGEGVTWARSLVNDCLYRAALCYKYLGDKPKTIEFYLKHIKNRKVGISSIYNLQCVKKEFNEYREKRKFHV